MCRFSMRCTSRASSSLYRATIVSISRRSDRTRITGQFPFEMQVVDNSLNPDVKVTADLHPTNA